MHDYNFSLAAVARPSSTACLVYTKSFPPEERRSPESLLELCAGEPRFTFMEVAASDGSVIGMATLWQLGEMTYMEHFAMDEAVRSRGIGGMVLDRLMALRPGPWLIEAEPARTGADAVRRLAFYRRHGFTERHDMPYIQPPYGPGLPAVPLTLLTARHTGDLQPWVARLKHTVYRAGDLI